MWVSTSEDGTEELLANGPNMKRVEIAILILANTEREFGELVQLINNEVRGYIQPRTIAQTCIKLRNKGLVKVTDNKGRPR